MFKITKHDDDCNAGKKDIFTNIEATHLTTALSFAGMFNLKEAQLL